MNGPIQPAWRVTLDKLRNTDYYFGASVDGFDGKTKAPIVRVREWWGWPNIDVPLPPKGKGPSPL